MIAVETAGAGNPEIDDALAAVDADWWTQVCAPYLDGANYTALSGWLAQRFTALEQMDGHAFAVRRGTIAELATAGELVNSPHITTPATEGSPSLAWVCAASLCGVAAFQAAVDPARQFATLEMPGWLPPQSKDRFTEEVRDMLLRKGISSMDHVSGVTRAKRLVTNYRLSPGGAEDTAYLDLMTLTTLAYLRWSLKNRIQLRFPRHKLASNDARVAPGQPIATPEIVRGEEIALYREWEDAGLVENAQFFIDRSITERADSDPNRINSLLTPDLINNFMIYAAQIQFRL